MKQLQFQCLPLFAIDMVIVMHSGTAYMGGQWGPTQRHEVNMVRDHWSVIRANVSDSEHKHTPYGTVTILNMP